MPEERMTRRDALKKAAYMTPVIVTFLAAPSFASGGSGIDERHEEYGGDEGYGGDEKGERRWVWNGERDAEGNRGNGKRGRRWLWDYQREERRRRKTHWWE